MTMTRNNTSAPSHKPTPHQGKSPLPATIWLPEHPRDDSQQRPPVAPAVLPEWAIDRIRAEFTHRPGRSPAPLLRVDIHDADPGMDARARCTTFDGDDRAAGPLVLLAELHPDALPITDAVGETTGALDEGWPGFFYRAFRLLRGGGLLLIATRQRRDSERLTDPLGTLTACARSAGFTYLQHIVIVHGHAADNRIVPTPPNDAPPGLIHSDLLVLSTPRTREGSRAHV